MIWRSFFPNCVAKHAILRIIEILYTPAVNLLRKRSTSRTWPQMDCLNLCVWWCNPPVLWGFRNTKRLSPGIFLQGMCSKAALNGVLSVSAATTQADSMYFYEAHISSSHPSYTSSNHPTLQVTPGAVRILWRWMPMPASLSASWASRWWPGSARSWACQEIPTTDEDSWGYMLHHFT